MSQNRVGRLMKWTAEWKLTPLKSQSNTEREAGGIIQSFRRLFKG